MRTLVLSLQGRFGNQTIQYLFARGFAEVHGMELRCDEWIGERIFDIPGRRPTPNPARRRYNEIELTALAESGQLPSDVEFRGYAQMQRCADYYTKRDAQAWLKIRPEIRQVCQNCFQRIVGHRRGGDYFGYGYPVVSRESYFLACEEYGLNYSKMKLLEEEIAEAPTGLPADISFAGDFYRMVEAKVLLRGNSSFSWVAALLGNGLVLSPVVKDLAGGREHLCRFVPGNWPRFANLDFVEDLHVAP